jgi:hypothetical protein
VIAKGAKEKRSAKTPACAADLAMRNAGAVGTNALGAKRFGREEIWARRDGGHE